MAGTERLVDFPADFTPQGADIVYVGDSTNTYNEVKVKISDLLKNVTAKNGFTATNSSTGTVVFPSLPIITPGNPSAVTLVSGVTNITSSSSQVTYTIPATPALGDYYVIIGSSPLGWLLAVDGSGHQTIYFNGAATNLGSTGVVVTPSSQFSAIMLQCIFVNPGVEYDFSISWSNSPLTLVTA